MVAAIPLNLAGWGPREGAAAWAFARGGARARRRGRPWPSTYGVLSLVATLPGAVLLVLAPAPGDGSPSTRGGGRPCLTGPYILLSCGMSIDGYLDNASSKRLLLSNEADLERVDAVRAASDAILVGAQTVRQDNPRLLVRSQRRPRRARRPRPAADPDQGDGHRAPGWTRRGRFFSDRRDRQARLLRRGRPSRGARAGSARSRPSSTAARASRMRRLVEDLHDRGTRRLMVEGGGSIHTQFLTAGLADELHLVVAPFFVGDSRAPRFVEDGRFPWNQDRRATLADVRRLGDVVLLRYALSDRYEDG